MGDVDHDESRYSPRKAGLAPLRALTTFQAEQLDKYRILENDVQLLQH